MKSHGVTTQTGSAALAALIAQIETTGDLSLLRELRQRFTQTDKAFGPDLMNKKEAAAYLTIAVRTLDDWRATKRVPCVTIGGIVRFRRSDLDAFLAAHTTQPRVAKPFRSRRVNHKPAA